MDRNFVWVDMVEEGAKESCGERSTLNKRMRRGCPAFPSSDHFERECVHPPPNFGPLLDADLPPLPQAGLGAHSLSLVCAFLLRVRISSRCFAAAGPQHRESQVATSDWIQPRLCPNWLSCERLTHVGLSLFLSFFRTSLSKVDVRAGGGECGLGVKLLLHFRGASNFGP